MQENKELVSIQKNELYVGTWDLAQGFKTEHRYLIRLLKKYILEFMEFEGGLKAFERRQVRQN